MGLRIGQRLRSSSLVTGNAYRFGDDNPDHHKEENREITSTKGQLASVRSAHSPLPEDVGAVVDDIDE